MNACTPRLGQLLARAGAALAVAATLAGCASPPARFYTLAADGSAATPTVPDTSADPAFLIQVPAVGVPEQVAKNQFVVQKSIGQVAVLEQERWASAPADEIRSALSSALTHQLDTIDVAHSAYPPGVPVYRVSVDVQRFESWPGQRAVLDAVWSVRSLSSQRVTTCHTHAAVPVSAGYDALVTGHRQAIGQLATEIAGTVRAMAAAQRIVKNVDTASPAMRCPSAPEHS
ncbi:TPA: membrane integrity-associated transporter subunit PqiC [Burkholderia aenigmatica]|uniref:PqiC family protein n=1 Tax=Burkholderia sp. AU45251 TaxID=3059204 RepID=UPI00264CF4A6|nr:PqiC family protein [Burkholderia sp. AU45251]HDR9484652.1 membrane integrity-associated transporter subunit PqiC [Burkholderia aenigmatica]MDN7516749.1 PqiC family protein [Burkholderia sp. AU45251]HDR9515928.1 membrane integrity-associated transporter subunit PqiC [Burkholderia aenigmatica]HDR9592737.1 membrane integrity-associated transporter subunit PqiC [Burkholderia aenigmatica]HDR9599717.1 membrane integrity-associated transporter subunit PqiC [Burkholderia aenigmatica]